MINIIEIKFARTVWAERQMAKLCPGNNIKNFEKVLNSEDTDAQFKAMEDVIIIMHQAYDRKEKYLNPEHECTELTKEDLENLTEEELSNLAVRAFSDFKIDGEVTVETEPKKEEAEELPMSESTSTIPGSSTSAIN